MLSHAYLTERQATIWNLRRKGRTLRTIAQQLQRSIQFVHKTLQQSDTKLLKSILELAKLNDISLQGDINTTQGIAFGFHERFQLETAITYSRRYGLQIWYKDNSDCTTCRIRSQCYQAILNLYQDRHYPLPPNHEQLPPRQLSETLFQHLRADHTPPTQEEVL